jgi:ParB-like chromosome segregation protein Spo0J
MDPIVTGEARTAQLGNSPGHMGQFVPYPIPDGESDSGPRRGVVSISELIPADPLRSSGEDQAHIVRLAESYEMLPPILVHRDTMRVIDGMHRVQAAKLKGYSEITVEFFDGTVEDAFLQAVGLNVVHGLPLSLSDRKAATQRILLMRPELSDRAIATLTGLSGKTVAGIRGRSTIENSHVAVRLGSDGRMRPVDPATGRREAAMLFGKFPDASLREIAASAGISPSTARDVRQRLKNGEDPAQRKPKGRTRNAAAPASPQASVVPVPPGKIHALSSHETGDPREVILSKLRKDPSLRLSEAGRKLLRWLHGHAVGMNDWNGLVDAVPPHCAHSVADLARRTAEAWNDFAIQLERRSTPLSSGLTCTGRVPC